MPICILISSDIKMKYLVKCCKMLKQLMVFLLNLVNKSFLINFCLFQSKGWIVFGTTQLYSALCSGITTESARNYFREVPENIWYLP